MGGHNAGEVASGKAIEFFVAHISEFEGVSQEGIAELMTTAVRHANRCVHNISCSDANLSGMGTTFTAATFADGKLYIAHLGDSRAYVVRPQGIRQITEDHTYVNDLVRASIISDEQARTHHLRNVITRALGSEEHCEVDAYVLNVQEGDRFLMCSDGLSTMLEDPAIEATIAESSGLESAIIQLINAANESGGYDNISVIMIGEGGA